MAQKKEGVTIAFLGTGAMDVDNATDLIEEFIEATITSDDDPVRFVFPLTTDEFTDTLGELVQMAKKSDITYEVITSTSDKNRRAFTDIANGAAKTYHVADVFTQMEQILVESPTAILEVLWDAEREVELTEIVSKFLDAEVAVLDLTDGNTPMAEEEPAESAEEVPQVTEDGEIVEADQAEVVYARADLEKLSRNEIKEITLALGLPARRSSDAMIEQIMETQGGFDEGADEPTTVTEVEMVVSEDGEIIESSDTRVEMHIGGIDTSVELIEAIRSFPNEMKIMLGEFLTDIAKTIEGLIFNHTPAEEQAPAAPTRRQSRSR